MFDAIKRRITWWMRVRDDIERLRQLDDHLLADTGITRKEIAARVSGRRR